VCVKVTPSHLVTHQHTAEDVESEWSWCSVKDIPRSFLCTRGIALPLHSLQRARDSKVNLEGHSDTIGAFMQVHTAGVTTGATARIATTGKVAGVSE
jgi:hypothetical protein